AEKDHHRSDASTAASSSFEQQLHRWTTPTSIAATCPAAVAADQPEETLAAPTPPPIPSAPFAPAADPSMRRSRSFVSSVSRIDWPLPPTTVPSAAGSRHHHAKHQEQRAEMPSASRAASRTATDGLPSPGSPAPPLHRDHLHRSLLLLPTRFPWFRRSNTSSAASSPATPPKQ
ncbi:hypothetical protein GGI21_004414, partial [Coemansia aciculifera]